MNDKELTNQIRTILMNELGLTREVVRTEMEKIVYDTMSKHMSKLFDQTNVTKIVERVVIQQFQTPNVPRENKLKELILRVAQEEVKKFVSQNIQIKKKGTFS